MEWKRLIPKIARYVDVALHCDKLKGQSEVNSTAIDTLDVKLVVEKVGEDNTVQKQKYTYFKSDI